MNGQRGLASDGPSQRAVSSGGNSTMSPTITGSGTNLLGKNSKVDPYYLILNVRYSMLLRRIPSE